MIVRTAVARVWGGENQVALSELRILDEIDQLDGVAAVEVLLADLPQIREGEGLISGFSRE